MNAKTFCDTNVFVYLFDSDAPAKKTRAAQIIRAEASQGSLVVSTQVLQEFYVSVTRKLRKPLSEAEASAATERLAAFMTIVVDSPMILRAVSLSQRARVSLWDALIVRAAIESGCRRLYSEDMNDGWSVEQVTVENPFRS